MLVRYVAPLVALIALLVFAASPAAAQEELPPGFKRCGDGDLVLVFMNPDLMPGEDGFIHAGGSFFIQFQARGEQAFDIEALKFSFGPMPPTGFPDNCTPGEWVTGPYVKNYRADYDPNDGFFIPINTCLVPDGTYAAALSAYDKDLNELVRYYTQAIVANGPGNNGEERCEHPDATVPWPMILPGDGERFDGGQGLYVEVGEDVSSIEAFINGKRIALSDGLGPERDDDLVPDLGYQPPIRDAGLAEGHHQKRQYPAFTWDGVITDQDVVRVRVVDRWGNVADKVVHVGDPTIGGRVTLVKPEFDLEFPQTDMESENGTARYNFSVATKGDGLHAHMFVRNKDGSQQLPGGITYRMNPDGHVHAAGDRTIDGVVTLIARPETEPGTYDVHFVVEYQYGAQRDERIVPLTFRVVERAQTDATQDEEVADTNREVEQQDFRGERVDQQAAGDDAALPEAKKGIPAIGLPLLVGGLALVAMARRRLQG